MSLWIRRFLGRHRSYPLQGIYGLGNWGYGVKYCLSRPDNAVWAVDAFRQTPASFQMRRTDIQFERERGEELYETHLFRGGFGRLNRVFRVAGASGVEAKGRFPRGGGPHHARASRLVVRIHSGRSRSALDGDEDPVRFSVGSGRAGHPQRQRQQDWPRPPYSRRWE